MSPTLWQHPELAPGLAALVAVALAAVALARWRARSRRRALGPRVRPGIPLAREAAPLLALAAIAVALVGPRIGERSVRTPSSGIDLVLLFDVSRSMDARDVPPSRLARARRAGEEVLARLSAGDRSGLAVFAGGGALLAPLTPDRAALTELLGGLDTGLIDPPSSELGAGMRAAMAAFEAGSERPRVVLVLSDGEDPERRGDLGASDATRADARVVALAFGSDLGAVVPAGPDSPLLADGSPVISRRQTERLARLAGATGGEVFATDRWGTADFDAVVSALRRDAGEGDGTGALRRVRAVWITPFALLAFALLAGEWLPLPSATPVRSRRRRALAAATVVAGLGIAAAPPPQAGPVALLEARLRARPGDARLLIALGLERLRRGRHAAAERALLAAALTARETDVAATAYYDLGVAALARGDLAAARDAFFDALALDPSDRQARFNLEWTLKALPPGPPPPGPPDPQEHEPDQAPPAQEQAPSPEPSPPDAEGERPEPPPSLSDADLRRWLGRVSDDPAQALRGLAGAAAPAAPRRGVAW